MRTIVALLRSAHPGPAVVVTVIEALLGVAVGLEPWRVAVLGATLAFNQLAIGLGNDWLDADRDRRAGRTDKPIARGELPAATARNVALGSSVLSVALSLLLGPLFALAHALAFAGGWTYNAWFKRSALSPLPYLVSFGLLPVLATLALPQPRVAVGWAVLAGALLGLAAHVANVLPDLADDAATGIRGLPHRLGLRVLTIVAGAALAGAAVALAVGLGFDPVTLAGLALSVAASVAAVVLGLRRRRAAFGLVMLAALVDVVLLVVAGARMIA